MSPAKRFQALRSHLSQQEDASALAVFRIGFGLIMCYDMIRYCWHFSPERMYLRTDFHFKYLGFGWVNILPGDGIYWHLSILAVLGLMIATGLFYRWATILFTLGFGWYFLIDRAQYLNHFYMVWLFSALLCVIPAHRLWSLDVRWRNVSGSDLSPRWARWLLLAQLEIVLIYAGIVKINPDWLNLAPLEQWLLTREDMWLIGELFTQRWAVAVAAYGVIALHLVGAPLLLLKRTRAYVLCIYASFHALNHFVFSIGIFPWVTLFTSFLCLEPDWPRQFWRRLGFSVKKKSEEAKTAARVAVTRVVPIGVPLIIFICAWLLVQLFLPLRHHSYAGDVAWNDNGHLFSWRMLLLSRRGILHYSRRDSLRYIVHDPVSGQQWSVNPRAYLTRKQVGKLVCRPDMVLQFAHYIAGRWESENELDDVEVYAYNRCSLNYREHQKQVDSTVDLTTVERTDSMAGWVLPLTHPLPNRLIPWERVNAAALE